MSWWSALWLALGSLRRNRLRSALTVLGIVIGVGAVVAMRAVGRGAQKYITERTSTFGVNGLQIVPSTADGRGSVMNALSEGDVRAIEREVPYVQLAAPFVSGELRVTAGSKHVRSRVAGTTPSYFSVRGWPLSLGDYFDATQVRAAAKVCLLGETVRAALFGTSDPVGQLVRLGTLPCRVIGVLRPKGVTFGLDQDDILIMPITTVRTRVLHMTGNGVSNIVISARDENMIEPARMEIASLLRQRHHLGDDQVDDFRITSQAELLASFQAQRQAVELLLVVVASIALLIGGIGVMNIMLVSVTERTREIGIRLAIGARRSEILSQFMIESLTLSGLGGAGGWMFGAIASFVLARITQWEVHAEWQSALLAFTLSSTVGILFGILPARRAASLDPITALRHE